MSGLTLGLLSLDLTALTVIMKGGDPKQRQYARKSKLILRLVPVSFFILF